VKEVVQPSYLAGFESFEVNLRLEELRKNGDRIKLPAQSFHILAMLLERPGEVVMRHEIQNRLWPNDTVVEFENSINAAIKRLRAALGDSADHPRYIETLARRGYRWMVLVEWIEPPSTSASVLSSSHAAEVVRTAPRNHRLLLIACAAAVAAAAITTSAYFLTHRAPKVTSKDPTIIADFVNTTGDPVFDGTLRQGLVALLQQSPYFDILSDEQLAGTLRLMGQPAGARLTHELSRQLCRRTGGGAVLDPSISQVGT
jgi:DNA-binding winged helix-turn-helix (wHTH) protein